MLVSSLVTVICFVPKEEEGGREGGVKTFDHCLSYFFICWDKIPGTHKLKEERFIWLTVVQVSVHSQLLEDRAAWCRCVVGDK